MDPRKLRFLDDTLTKIENRQLALPEVAEYFRKLIDYTQYCKRQGILDISLFNMSIFNNNWLFWGRYMGEDPESKQYVLGEDDETIRKLFDELNSYKSYFHQSLLKNYLTSKRLQRIRSERYTDIQRANKISTIKTT